MGAAPPVTVTVPVPVHCPLQAMFVDVEVVDIFEQGGIPAREFNIKEFPAPSVTFIGHAPGGVAVVPVANC